MKQLLVKNTNSRFVQLLPAKASSSNPIGLTWKKTQVRSVLYVTRLECYTVSTCGLHFRPLTRPKASSRPAASIFSFSGLNSIQIPQQYYGRSSRVLNSGRLGINTPKNLSPYAQILSLHNVHIKLPFSCLFFNNKLQIDVRICIWMFFSPIISADCRVSAYFVSWT